jgi:lipopolysaccharide export system protein LptA
VALLIAAALALPAVLSAQAPVPAPRPASGAPAPGAAPGTRPLDGKAQDGKLQDGKLQDGKLQDGKRQEDRSQPVTVDSDRMERFGKESLIIFSGNVVARQNNSVQYADRMEVYLDENGDKILRTVSTGSVRIVTRDCKTGTARRAEYYELEQRVVLIGNARVWQDDNVVSGDTITIFLAQDRNVVTGGKQERVKAVFYSKDGGNAKPAPGPGSAAACVN